MILICFTASGTDDLEATPEKSKKKLEAKSITTAFNKATKDEKKKKSKGEKETRYAHLGEEDDDDINNEADNVDNAK